jgi:hypothetical protein
LTTSQPPEGQHCAACLATGEPMTAQNGGGWACTDVPACTARLLARIGQPVTAAQARVLSGQPADDAPALTGDAQEGRNLTTAQRDEPGPADGAACEAQTHDSGYGYSYTCTLPAGHDWPEHIAHGASDNVCHRWPAEPGPRPSLRENVSGRSEPRPSGDVKHDVRWYGSSNGIVANCKPCLWARTIEDAYTTGQLVRLAEQHCGVTA